MERYERTPNHFCMCFVDRVTGHPWPIFLVDNNSSIRTEKSPGYWTTETEVTVLWQEFVLQPLFISIFHDHWRGFYSREGGRDANTLVFIFTSSHNTLSPKEKTGFMKVYFGRCPRRGVSILSFWSSTTPLASPSSTSLGLREGRDEGEGRRSVRECHWTGQTGLWRAKWEWRSDNSSSYRKWNSFRLILFRFESFGIAPVSLSVLYVYPRNVFWRLLRVDNTFFSVGTHIPRSHLRLTQEIFLCWRAVIWVSLHYWTSKRPY